MLQSGLVDGPVQFTSGVNVEARLLETEMTRLEGCRLLSLDMDKWGKLTCYDDMIGWHAMTTCYEMTCSDKTTCYEMTSCDNMM